ncbi:hypothetical protein BC629DRAFT_1543333 [Irpex lacteus]|nr:hypothetical protein BC629DRAFT_1543333 [Irpex lacteus]
MTPVQKVPLSDRRPKPVHRKENSAGKDGRMKQEGISTARTPRTYENGAANDAFVHLKQRHIVFDRTGNLLERGSHQRFLPRYELE